MYSYFKLILKAVILIVQDFHQKTTIKNRQKNEKPHPLTITNIQNTKQANIRKYQVDDDVE